MRATSPDELHDVVSIDEVPGPEADGSEDVTWRSRDGVVEH